MNRYILEKEDIDRPTRITKTKGKWPMINSKELQLKHKTETGTFMEVQAKVSWNSQAHVKLDTPCDLNLE